jgi:hypothetical protein
MMSDLRKASVCILIQGHSPDLFRSWFGKFLNHLPVGQVELRLGFAQATECFHYALGTLNPDGGWPERNELPGAIERFGLTAKDSLRVWAWYSPGPLAREALARLLLHDVPVTADYAICLDQDSNVEAGWWDALVPLMEQGIDYIGQPGWHEYGPGEAERVQAQPWYMGAPLARREGRLGVSYMRGGVMAVRAERLREVQYPGEVWLGETANQFGWTRATPSLPAPLPLSTGGEG